MPGYDRRRPPADLSSPQTTQPQQGPTTDRGNADSARDIPPQTEERTSWLDAIFGRDKEPPAANNAPTSAAPAEWAQVTGGSLLLRRGARGEAVRFLQQQLNANGASIDADGVFGGGTDRAVREYQGANRMTVDGVVGKGTAARLAGVSAAAKKKPEASEDRARKQDKGAPDIAVSAGQFEGEGLQRAVLSVALDVFVNGWKAGKTTKMIYTIIDFSMPSTEKRLFILNLEAGTLIRKELVTHGGKSGGNQPTKFSNREGSNQSSIGLARTGGTYEGKHGTSLYLEGLEEGYNSNMKDRHVVMHAADYATPEAIKANGGTRLGRSEGCPAMDPRVAGDVIDTVKNGTLVFSYYPDPKYLEQSEYVNG